MQVKLTADKSAVVATDLKWVSFLDRVPPRGAKVLLIDRRLGAATLGQWTNNGQWTHWFPLPTFGVSK